MSSVYRNTIDGTFGLSLNSAGVTNLQGAIGSDTALASITTDANGTTQVGGNITTTGLQSFGDAVVLTNGVALSGSNITFDFA